MTPWSLRTAVTPDTKNENYERFLTFSCKSLKFSTKWYTNFVFWLSIPEKLRYKVKFGHFFKKKAQKKGSEHLKG